MVPEHIALKIKEIQAAYLAEGAPLAETVEIHPATGVFRAVPIPVQNAPLIGTLLARVRDAVEDALRGDNGLNQHSREVRVLERTVARYGNDPQRVEMDFTSVAVGLRRQINETQDLPPLAQDRKAGVHGWGCFERFVLDRKTGPLSFGRFVSAVWLVRRESPG